MFSVGGFGEVPEEFKKFRKVRTTGIVDFCESPAHFESSQILKEREETRAMEMGTAIHMAVLEPEKFEKTYICDLKKEEHHLVTSDDIKEVLKKLDLKVSGTKAELIDRLRATNDPRREFIYDLLREEHTKGREILSEKEWHACKRIVGRIEKNPKLKFVLSGGEAEMLGWVFHDLTQTVISFRLDHFKKFAQKFLQFDGCIVDVKKFRNVSRRKFEAAIWDTGVYIQAAVYTAAMNALTKSSNMYMWVAVDDKAPYSVMGYYADPGMIEAGTQEFNKALLGIEECYKTEHWPVYSEDILPATLPAYAWQQLEYQDEEHAS